MLKPIEYQQEIISLRETGQPAYYETSEKKDILDSLTQIYLKDSTYIIVSTYFYNIKFRNTEDGWHLLQLLDCMLLVSFPFCLLSKQI